MTHLFHLQLVALAFGLGAHSAVVAQLPRQQEGANTGASSGWVRGRRGHRLQNEGVSTLQKLKRNK